MNLPPSLVWDDTSDVTGDAYGSDATVYYRVFKIKALPHANLTSEQAANVPQQPVITGSVAVADNCGEHNCAMIWSGTSAQIDVDGTTSAPQANLGTSALAFAGIDVSSWFNGTAGAKSALYSTTYFAVMLDGAVHDVNESVTATLNLTSLSTSAS